VERKAAGKAIEGHHVALLGRILSKPCRGPHLRAAFLAPDDKDSARIDQRLSASNNKMDVSMTHLKTLEQESTAPLWRAKVPVRG
jgi:hypothetical protein